MTNIRRQLAATMLLGFTLTGAGLSGCKQEGPAETAGKKIDQAGEKTGEALDKAGEAVKKAAEKTGDALEKTGDKIEDAAKGDKK